MTTQPRQPRGTTNGGQFAGSHHGETADTLTAPHAGHRFSGLTVMGANLENPSVSIERIGSGFVVNTPGGPLWMRGPDDNGNGGMRLTWGGDLTVNGVPYEGDLGVVFVSADQPGSVIGLGQLKRKDAPHWDWRRSRPTDAAEQKVRQWVADASALAVRDPEFNEVWEEARRNNARHDVERISAQVDQKRADLARHVAAVEAEIAEMEAEHNTEIRIADGGAIDDSTLWGS